MLFSDNIIENAGNFFIAYHLSLTTTRFLTTQDEGMAFARSAVYLGNSVDPSGDFFPTLSSQTLKQNTVITGNYGLIIGTL